MRRRRAFTLVELLVVVGIVGLLVGLLLPAVQKVREAANAARCRSNLRQVGVAVLLFADEFGAFPPARVVERPDGVDPPELRCGGAHASWIVRILPYLEQRPAFDQWDLTLPIEDNETALGHTPLAVFLCPSRRTAAEGLLPSQTGEPIFLPCGCSFPGQKVVGGAVTDYAGNHGDLSPGAGGLATDFYWGGNGTGVIISSRARCDGDRPIQWIDRVRLADLTDGASYTFLAGELHVPAGRLAEVPDNGALFDGSRFHHMSRVGGPGVPLARGPFDDVNGMGLFAFGSWHAGTCHFIHGDGRVTALRNDIRTDLLERLCNRGDGLVIDPVD